MAQYLVKGRPVLLEGRLKLDQWQDKDGNNRSKLKVVVENFQFLGSRGEGGGGNRGGGGGDYAATPAPGPPPAGQNDGDDSIPF